MPRLARNPLALLPRAPRIPQTTSVSFYDLLLMRLCVPLYPPVSPCHPQTTPVMPTYTLALAAGDLKSSGTVTVDAVAGWVGRRVPYPRASSYTLAR